MTFFFLYVLVHNFYLFAEFNILRKNIKCLMSTVHIYLVSAFFHHSANKTVIVHYNVQNCVPWRSCVHLFLLKIHKTCNLTRSTQTSAYDRTYQLSSNHIFLKKWRSLRGPWLGHTDLHSLKKMVLQRFFSKDNGSVYNSEHSKNHLHDLLWFFAWWNGSSDCWRMLNAV